MGANSLGNLLRNLIPNSQEELSLLRSVLTYAQQLQKGPSLRSDAESESFDLAEFLRQIPEEAKRYLHGLVEAMEIYQTIKGTAVPVTALALGDARVYELKQIRDMCLEEGPRLIY